MPYRFEGDREREAMNRSDFLDGPDYRSGGRIPDRDIIGGDAPHRINKKYYQRMKCQHCSGEAVFRASEYRPTWTGNLTCPVCKVGNIRYTTITHDEYQRSLDRGAVSLQDS